MPILLDMYAVYPNITDVACHLYNLITTAVFYFSGILNTLRNVRLILTPGQFFLRGSEWNHSLFVGGFINRRLPCSNSNFTANRKINTTILKQCKIKREQVFDPGHKLGSGSFIEINEIDKSQMKVVWWSYCYQNVLILIFWCMYL